MHCPECFLQGVAAGLGLSWVVSALTIAVLVKFNGWFRDESDYEIEVER